MKQLKTHGIQSISYYLSNLFRFIPYMYIFSEASTFWGFQVLPLKWPLILVTISYIAFLVPLDWRLAASSSIPVHLYPSITILFLFLSLCGSMDYRLSLTKQQIFTYKQIPVTFVIQVLFCLLRKIFFLVPSSYL